RGRPRVGDAGRPRGAVLGRGREADRAGPDVGPAPRALRPGARPARGERGGVVLSGDFLQRVPSRHVSFMWSYPNLIPLSAAKVRRIAEILEPFAFDAVYGAVSARGQLDAN